MRLRNIPGADEAVSNSPWVIQDAETKKGKWSEVFGKDQPLYIEVGMGKGQFITELSRRNPEINYIGIERYTSVLYRALQKRELLTEECGEEFPNLRYLCVDAKDLPNFFGKGEVDRIYLNFSDPWPKERHARRRLTSREFLARYEEILADGGRLAISSRRSGATTARPVLKNSGRISPPTPSMRSAPPWQNAVSPRNISKARFAS